MLQQAELVRIRWQDCILQDVACSPALFPAGQGYIVLTDNFLGWRSSALPWNFPLLFPREYSVLPLASITHVNVHVENLGTEKTVRIHYESGNGETELIELQVGWLHRWVRAFRILGIPVSGGEAVKLTTVRGLMNDYGWFFGFGILGFAWVFSFILGKRTIRIGTTAISS
jgi:hypothetical protein